MKPVSVILPTYNRREKLQLSVESVLRQSYSNFELIIVDDGSTDQTEEYVNSISDQRVVYYRLPINSGVCVARNKGVELASHDIIAFQDSDDIWKKEKLQIQMDYWKKNGEDVLIYSAYEYDGEKRIPDSNIKALLEGEIHQYLLCRNTIGAPTILIKKNVFEAVGGFDDKLKALEDWDFVIRVARIGKIGYVEKPLVKAGVTEGGLSSNVSNYFDARCQMLIKYMDDLNKYGLVEAVMTDLFEIAKKYGIVESVQKMLQLKLKEKESQIISGNNN